MNLAVFLPNWVGDAVMATPALRALRSLAGMRGRMVAVSRPYIAEVLAGVETLDEQILFDPHSRDPEMGSWSVIKQLRACSPDAIVLLTNSLRTGLIAWATGARERIGYARYGRSLTLTKRLYPSRRGGKRIPTPAIDSYLELAYAAGAPRQSPRLDLTTLPSDEAAADAVWEKYSLPPGDEVVVLNSSGAFGAAKLWPSEYFGELARRIVERHGLRVLVVCGPNERQTAQKIVHEARHPGVISLAGEPVSLGLTKACVRRSRMLVTTDSGPRFFGVAFGLPVVTLFGPTFMDWTSSHYAGEICLQHEVPCGPCMRHVCPYSHHRCMRDLTVERVYQAVERQLEPGRRRAA
ncbi:MAG TPA: glycosyltransferase family 9 protein [Pirellulales bacterium]|nr:glycosyltransferase family 9 protein [Pirellulales bacterium]